MLLALGFLLTKPTLLSSSCILDSRKPLSQEPPTPTPRLSSLIGGDSPGQGVDGLEQQFMEAQLLSQGASRAFSLAGNPPGFRTSAAWPCWAGDTSER